MKAAQLPVGRSRAGRAAALSELTPAFRGWLVVPRVSVSHDRIGGSDGLPEVADHQPQDRHADQKDRAADEDPLDTVGHHRPQASQSERAEECETEEPKPIL